MFSLAAGPDGSLYIAGQFTEADGYARNGLVKLLPGGGVDPNWNPAPSPAGAVGAIAIDEAGNLFAGGNFAQIGSQPIAYLGEAVGSEWHSRR